MMWICMAAEPKSPEGDWSARPLHGTPANGVSGCGLLLAAAVCALVCWACLMAGGEYGDGGKGDRRSAARYEKTL